MILDDRLPYREARFFIQEAETKIEFAGLVSVKEGGTLIQYEDEDPQIRRDFAEVLNKDGIELAMPPVVYRS